MLQLSFLGLISHVTRNTKMRAVFFAPEEPEHIAFFIVTRGCDILSINLLDYPLEIIGTKKAVKKTSAFTDHIPPLQSISGGQQIVSAVVRRRTGKRFAGFVDYHGTISASGFYCHKVEYRPVVQWPGVRCIARIVEVAEEATGDTVILRNANDPDGDITIPADSHIWFGNIPCDWHALVAMKSHFADHYSIFANITGAPLGLPAERERCPQSKCELEPFDFLHVECSNSQVP